MAKVWTVEMIRSLIVKGDEKSNIFIERSLLRLYARQTADEQSTETTNHNNGMGFTGADAPFLSRLAVWVINGEKFKKPEGARLSDKQRAIVRKRLPKYAGQLLATIQ